MALTKIFTGMEQGPEKIDANFKSLDGSSPKIITDWTSDGISYKNGCTVNTDTANRIQYRVINLGDTKFLNISGWVNVPALTSNQTIVAFTLPVSVVSPFDKYSFIVGYERSPWGDLLAAYDINTQTGDFRIQNKNGNADGKADASSYMINYGRLS